MDLATALRFVGIFQGTVAAGLIVAILFYRMRLRGAVDTREIIPIKTSILLLVLLIYTVLGLMAIAARFDDPITWRTPLLGLAFILTDLTLGQLASYEYKRFQVRKDLKKNLPGG